INGIFKHDITDFPHMMSYSEKIHRKSQKVILMLFISLRTLFFGIKHQKLKQWHICLGLSSKSSFASHPALHKPLDGMTHQRVVFIKTKGFVCPGHSRTLSEGTSTFESFRKLFFSSFFSPGKLQDRPSGSGSNFPLLLMGFEAEKIHSSRNKFSTKCFVANHL
uniref:Uncharacterized protein n=1 Tax=Scleropages formosus TaxID=113540 RepID=A0A8C9WEU3_SCLFO